MACDKMPQPLTLEECDNDWNRYLDKLYQFYLEDFFKSTFKHNGLPLNTFTELDYNLRQQTFDHITTKGTNDRLYNEARCQKIKWIKPILTGTCSECKAYRYFPDLDWKHKQFRRYIVWCVDEEFIIIVELRKDAFFLISAYCLVYKDKKEQLEKKYRKFLANNKSA